MIANVDVVVPYKSYPGFYIFSDGNILFMYGDFSKNPSFGCVLLSFSSKTYYICSSKSGEEKLSQLSG